MTDDPTVKVAADLRALADLAERLLTQAVAKANDPLMPGGLAMVALAPVASPEAWEHRQGTTERTGRPYTSPEDEDEDDEALRTLLFWSEQLRLETEVTMPARPTIGTEATFLRLTLPWIYDNEPHYEDMARDIAHARTRMENLLLEGQRTTRGVPCFDCGASLVRPTVDRREHNRCEGHNGICVIPHQRCPHDRGGLRDEWKCPGCERVYSEDDYRRAVQQQHTEKAEWLAVDACSERTDVPVGTIRVWANRGDVRKRKDHETGRMTYNVPDVLSRFAPDEVA